MTTLTAYYIVITTKLKYSVLCGMLFSPVSLVFFYFKKYLLTDTEFFVILMFGILIDLFIGIAKHIKLKTFDHKLMLYGLMEKVTISVSASFLFSLFYYIVNDTQNHMISYWFQFTCRMVVMTYVAIPTLVNMNIISNGKFPPSSFINVFRKYNETLDPRDLKIKLEQENKK